MAENVYAAPPASLETQPAPQELWQMDFKQLKRLSNASRKIGILGVIYSAGAAFLILGVIASGRTLLQYDVWLLGAVFFKVVIPLVGAILCFKRPREGRWIGMLLCVMMVPAILSGTAMGVVFAIIGLLGLEAYAHGKRLFGADRLRHKDIVAVYEQRRKAKT